MQLILDTEAVIDIHKKMSTLEESPITDPENFKNDIRYGNKEILNKCHDNLNSEELINGTKKEVDIELNLNSICSANNKLEHENETFPSDAMELSSKQNSSKETAQEKRDGNDMSDSLTEDEEKTTCDNTELSGKCDNTIVNDETEIIHKENSIPSENITDNLEDTNTSDNCVSNCEPLDSNLEENIDINIEELNSIDDAELREKDVSPHENITLKITESNKDCKSSVGNTMGTNISVLEEKNNISSEIEPVDHYDTTTETANIDNQNFELENSLLKENQEYSITCGTENTADTLVEVLEDPVLIGNPEIVEEKILEEPKTETENIGVTLGKTKDNPVFTGNTIVTGESEENLEESGTCNVEEILDENLKEHKITGTANDEEILEDPIRPVNLESTSKDNNNIIDVGDNSVDDSTSTTNKTLINSDLLASCQVSNNNKTNADSDSCIGMENKLNKENTPSETHDSSKIAEACTSNQTCNPSISDVLNDAKSKGNENINNKETDILVQTDSQNTTKQPDVYVMDCDEMDDDMIKETLTRDNKTDKELETKDCEGTISDLTDSIIPSAKSFNGKDNDADVELNKEIEIKNTDNLENQDSIIKLDDSGTECIKFENITETIEILDQDDVNDTEEIDLKKSNEIVNISFKNLMECDNLQNTYNLESKKETDKHNTIDLMNIDEPLPNNATSEMVTDIKDADEPKIVFDTDDVLEIDNESEVKQNDNSEIETAQADMEYIEPKDTKKAEDTVNTNIECETVEIESEDSKSDVIESDTDKTVIDIKIAVDENVNENKTPEEIEPQSTDNNFLLKEKPVTPKKIVSKLSNTLNILSDDEDMPSDTEVKDTETNIEKHCINIDDDDDILLIEEDEEPDCKPDLSQLLPKIDIKVSEIDGNCKTIFESVKEESIISNLVIPESDTQEILHASKPDSPVMEKDVLEEEKITKQKKNTLLPENFLKKFRKKLTDMTRDEVEEFCALKIVESIVDRTNLGEITSKLKNMAQSVEEFKRKALILAKQNRDLQVVLKSVQEEQKKRSDTVITPLKITRSVGMQVIMQEKPTAKKKPNPNYNANNIKHFRTPNSSPKQQKQLATQQIPTNQQIPVPRLIPAHSPGLRPINLPMAPNNPNKTLSPVMNGVRTPTPKAGEKRPHSRVQGQSVTVDLTDDEPPVKLPARILPVPPVRLVSPQNLLAPTRQPFTGPPLNSPRKVYIPISGPQNQSIRPGQTIMLKSIPGPRPRCPTPQLPRMPQNTIRMTRIHNRHPAPLPDAMKQYQPPNWKALPPAPDLKLSKVENGIVISWKIENYQVDNYEDIASYQLYAYQETSSPPSTALWKKIGDVKALPLPMACTLTQFMAGFKYYFAVRAVDVRSRLGPFSLPASILLLNKT